MRRLAWRSWMVRCGWLLSVLVGGGWVEAASGDADGTYAVTVTKIEASLDGSTFTTLFEGSQRINIAAVNAGAVAAGLVSGVDMADGTYTTVRVTIADTLTAKGFVNNGATTIYTDGGTDTGAFSTNSSAANTPGTDYAISTFTVPADNRVNTTSGLSIKVADGTSATVTVAFDTSGVITQTGGIPSLSAPTVTISSR